MTEITLGGKTFEIRPLKRKEVRKLTEDGIDIFNPTVEQAVGPTGDAVFAILLPGRENDFEEMDIPDFLKLFQEAMTETRGSKVEEKNSPTGGDGQAT